MIIWQIYHTKREPLFHVLCLIPLLCYDLLSFSFQIEQTSFKRNRFKTFYSYIFERFDSLLDYYDRFIQETLGISLPVEDGNNETTESTDESTESEETEDLSVDAGDEDSTDVPAEDDDGEDSSEAGCFDEPSAKDEKTETSLEDGNDSSDTTEETVEEEDALENAEEGDTEEPDEQPVVWDKLVGYY